MAEFSINVNSIGVATNELNYICSTMNTCNKNVSDIANSSTLNSMTYYYVRQSLNTIMKRLFLEKQQTEVLKNTLMEIVKTYNKADSDIVTGGIKPDIWNQIQDILKNHEDLWGVLKKLAGNTGEDKNGVDDLIASIFSGLNKVTSNHLTNAICSLGKETKIKINGKKLSLLDVMSMVNKKTYLTSIKKGDTLFLKLKGNMTHAERIKWVKENLGVDVTKYDAKLLRDGKLDLSKSKKLKDLKYEDLIGYDLNYNKLNFDSWGSFGKSLKGFGKTFWSELGENLKFWDDFNPASYKGLSKFSKTTKVLGAVGTVATVGSDVVDNFYNPETGQWTYSNKALAYTVSDVAIDISSGAACTAAGAAIGSCFAPPIGTVVGGVAGFGFNVVTNVGVADWDGDGQKDSLVDGAKMLGHAAIDGIADAGEAVYDWGKDRLEDIGDGLADLGKGAKKKLNQAADAVGDFFSGWF